MNYVFLLSPTSLMYIHLIMALKSHIVNLENLYTKELALVLFIFFQGWWWCLIFNIKKYYFSKIKS